MVERDLEDDARRRLAVARVTLDAQIPLCQTIDVLDGAVAGPLDDPAAHFEVPKLVVGIDHAERHGRSGGKIAILLAAFGGVDEDVLAVEVNPHRCHLRASIWHQRREMREDRFREQIEKCLWYSRGHEHPPSCFVASGVGVDGHAPAAGLPGRCYHDDLWDSAGVRMEEWCRMATTIRAVTAIPLRYAVPAPYGSARGMVSARTTCLVRLETTAGHTGYGEAFGPPLIVAAQVEELAPLFIGADPFDREVVWSRATNERYHWGRGGIHLAALSGLEIACWDLMGQVTGLPVAKLLGGWNRDDVLAYASTGYFTMHEGGFRAAIEAAVGEGFRHIKIKCGDGIRSDLERIDLVYEIAGEDAQLLVDLNGNYTADLALELALELEARGIGWLEEPLPAEDHTGYQRLRDGCQIPIAAGEADAMRTGFRELLSRRLVDIVQPDITTCGGLGEAKAIVAMAQAWNIRYSPHVWGGGIALAAALQLAAATPRYPHVEREAAPLLFEYDRGANALRDELLSTPIVATAERIAIPYGPGLGVSVDPAALERYRLGAPRAAVTTRA